MSTKQHIFLLTLLLILACVWINFLGPIDSNTMVRMNQLKPVKQQSPKELTYFRKGNTQSDFIRKPSILRMCLHWIFFYIYVLACLYKIACDHQSDYKWEYLKKCDILRFLQRQNNTVMCLADYYRDRINNNLSTHELMKYEWARYESFKTYPKSAPHFPSTLARDGFYYTGDGTFVTCFCCGNRLDTAEHENIAEAHRHRSPNCRFARGESSANVPINHRAVDSRTGLNGNPRYDTEASRRDSYRSWPQTSPAITMQLAEAGFYYVGTNDSVRCFSCRLCLRDWTPNRDPWRVHALYSPQCQHVKRCKGDNFIRKICLTVTNGTSRQETHSSDEMSHDLQSGAAQILLQMGHSVTRIKDAILHFRRRRGNRKLSAKALIEYLHDTEPNLSGPNSYSPSLLAWASAARSNMNDASHPERAPNRTVHESRTQRTTGTSKLQEEIDQLKHQKVCKICLDKDVCIVFLPCGHLVACEDCAPALRMCAVCRAPIRGTIRTYIS
ncbi:putative inhibitor of apoptosis [Mercenaria mercenaria]|uniref:putative inhibitor of apoptosis n=1 Tax=Mercenaria mercenaria TaxID=6596 RepID=UPI00234F626A|nr:putative inhibitor of apoptosis [Mercenaria mercenaria]